jgi:hypothetical protein
MWLLKALTTFKFTGTSYSETLSSASAGFHLRHFEILLKYLNSFCLGAIIIIMFLPSSFGLFSMTAMLRQTGFQFLSAGLLPIPDGSVHGLGT